VDLPKRRGFYNEMWPELRKDLPITYLWTPRNIVGMSAKLNGFRPIPDGMIRIQGLELAK
jgi:peptide/nickel transport system substrate-binding protein